MAERGEMEIGAGHDHHDIVLVTGQGRTCRIDRLDHELQLVIALLVGVVQVYHVAALSEAATLVR